MPKPILGNRYEVQQQLGQKPGRRTLLALDLQSQTTVVIKLLVFDAGVEWDEMKLFEREAETLKTLSHPAIPQYLDHFEVQLRSTKGFALIQTYIQGTSLETYLQSGRIFSETAAKQIARTLLEILIYLHGQQPPVIHRDIKPSNILLPTLAEEDLSQVSLIDFGSVRNSDGENSAFTVVGTYGYMPPEQFTGRTLLASDLYSLGATLITLLTGIHPSSLPRVGVRLDFEQVTNLSPAFTDWLKWMTEPGLERRLNSAAMALQVLLHEQVRATIAPIIPKPAGSKVQLVKTAEALEVVIPALVSQTRLRIDAQQIALESKVLGVKVSRSQSAPRQEIHRLEYSRARSLQDLLRGIPSQSDHKARLTIGMGTHKYELGDELSLSESELDWLAHELSQWLNLPLT